MRKVYHLDERELKKVKFHADLISDRSNIPNDEIGPKKKWWIYRRDMYWIHVQCLGEDLGALSVDPSFQVPEEFSVDTNWCHAEPMSVIKEAARKWFMKQPEYRQQVEWNKALIERETAAKAV